MTVGTPSTNYQSDAWYQNNKETKLNLVHNDYTALSQNGYKDVTFTGSKFYIRGAWNSNGSDPVSYTHLSAGITRMIIFLAQRYGKLSIS